MPQRGGKWSRVSVVWVLVIAPVATVRRVISTYRLQLHVERGKVKLLTRSGLDWTTSFAHIAQAAKKFPNCIIDGEAVALNEHGVSSFSLLQEALSSGDSSKLTFFVFDLLFLRHRDLRPRALTERKAALGKLIKAKKPGGRIRYVDHHATGADAVLMRIMDGLMAIPSILLAIAVVSLSGASMITVMIAITIPEIPRVARLVRSVVLTAREEPYVEAAISVGSSLPKIMWRHLMPNTIAPLIVQGTYVCASAILTEAILSFLGAGISPETPTWGNIMAEGRAYFQIAPSLIFWPGLLLSIAILSVNLIGDAARDALDPRMKRREGAK